MNAIPQMSNTHEYESNSDSKADEEIEDLHELGYKLFTEKCECSSDFTKGEVTEIKGGFFVNLNRKSYYHGCPIGTGRKHENENMYLMVKKEMVLLYCRRGCEKDGKPFLHLGDLLTEEEKKERAKRYRKSICEYNYYGQMDDKMIPWDAMCEFYDLLVTDQESYNRWFKNAMKVMNEFCVFVQAIDPFIVYMHRGKWLMGGRIGKFKEAYGMFSVCPWKDDKKIQQSASIASMWCKWLGCRKVKNVDCDPTNECDGWDTLNTFTGLALTREKVEHEITFQIDHDETFGTKKRGYDLACLEKFQQHIRDTICDGDEGVYSYVTQWLAHLVQRPGVKMGTILVMLGLEGTGKGLVANVLEKILGEDYYYHPTSIDAVFGQFNAGIEGKVLLFLDELAWGGSHTADGVIKKMATESKVTINQKGMPMRDVSNRFNLIIASNCDWVVAAGQNARRYVVLKVGDGLLSMSQEQKKMIYGIEPYVVAEWLYSISLDGFDSRDIPNTEGLKEQKMISMSPFHKWFVDWVSGEYTQFETQIKISDLFDHYRNSEHASKGKITIQSFAKNINQIYKFQTQRRTTEMPYNQVDSNNAVASRRAEIKYYWIPPRVDLVNALNKLYNSEML